MTTTQVVETSVTVNNNSPIQVYVHLDDQTKPTFEMTSGFKRFTVVSVLYISDRWDLPHSKTCIKRKPLGNAVVST